jgi:hypothetical protein
MKTMIHRRGAESAEDFLCFLGDLRVSAVKTTSDD